MKLKTNKDTFKKMSFIFQDIKYFLEKGDIGGYGANLLHRHFTENSHKDWNFVYCHLNMC